MLIVLSLSWVTAVPLVQGSEYGVRWKLIVDEVADYDLPCERLGDAAGLTTKDFDRVFPWSQMQLCKIITDADGVRRICHAGEPDFVSEKVRGNVMVEIPKHYTKRVVSDGCEARFISSARLPGYYVDPAFVENGIRFAQTIRC